MKKLLLLNIQKFANPLLPANGTHELQERYATTIIKLKRKENVVRNLFGRDYEGDPLSGAVKIPKRDAEVAVGDYDLADGGALSQGATEYVTVTIGQHKFINEMVDSYEANAVPDQLQAQRLDSASYSLGRVQELHAVSVIEAGTASANTTLSTESTAYKNVKTEIAVLKKLGIAPSDMRIIMSVDFEDTMFDDTKFANSAGALGAELLREGVVGKVTGVNTYTSANLSADVEFIVFSPLWAQTIEDWKVMPSFKNLTNEYIGSSALQARMVYQDALLDATTCRVKKFA